MPPEAEIIDEPLFPLKHETFVRVVVEVGKGLIENVVVEAGEGQPVTVAETEYVPAFAVVTLAMVGFCKDEVKLFGPDQVYEALAIVPAVRDNVLPRHIGPLLVTEGVAGI